MLVPHVFQRIVTWYCQIPDGLMDVLVQTDSSRGPRAGRWGWWHRTPRCGNGLMKRKALYKVGWVSFSPFHRWEIKAQEGFPTCEVHKSLWNLPLTVLFAAPHTQRPCLQKDGFAFLCWHIWQRNDGFWVALGGLSLYRVGKSVGLRAGTSSTAIAAGRTAGESIQVRGAEMLQHLALPSCTFFSKTPCARQNTCAGRWTVPKQLRESSSWPLICSKVGWIDSAAVEAQVDEGAGGQGW